MPPNKQDLTYHTVMWAEMQPDLYHGDKCDEVKPRWHCQCEGEMVDEPIELDPNSFPAGTKILVQ